MESYVASQLSAQRLPAFKDIESVALRSHRESDESAQRLPAFKDIEFG